MSDHDNNTPIVGHYSVLEAIEKFPNAAWPREAEARWLLASAVKVSRRELPDTYVPASAMQQVGATDADLAQLPSPPSTAALSAAWEHVQTYLERRRLEQRDEAAEQRRREKLRADDGYVPLDEVVFDYGRDLLHLDVPEYLIDGLVESGVIAQLIAVPGIGKTLVAIGWACCLAAAGRHVVYVAGDDPEQEVVRRVVAWCVLNSMEPDEVFEHLTLYTRAAQFADPDDMDAIAAVVKARGSVLVVFDTQHRCSGGLDENSNNDSRVIAASAARLTSLGATVVLIHHTADGKTGRGAKSVHGFVSTVLEVSKVTGGLRVRTVKRNNGADDAEATYLCSTIEMPEVIGVTGKPVFQKDGYAVNSYLDPFDDAKPVKQDVQRAARLYAVLTTAAAANEDGVTQNGLAATETLKAAAEFLSAHGLGSRGSGKNLVKDTVKTANDDGLLTSRKAGSTTKYRITDAGRERLSAMRVEYAAVIGD